MVIHQIIWVRRIRDCRVRAIGKYDPRATSAGDADYPRVTSVRDADYLRVTPIIGKLLRAVLYTVAAAVLCLTGFALSSESGEYSDDSYAIKSRKVINGEFLNASSYVGADSYSAGSDADERSNITVTEQGRYEVIQGRAGTVTVSGAGCVVHVLEGAYALKIELTESARGSRVIIDGIADEINVSCIDVCLTGTGRADTIRLNRIGTVIVCKCDCIIDAADRGLSGAAVSIEAPDVLAAGEALIARCRIDDAEQGKACRIIWYIDGTEVMTDQIVTGTALPAMTHLYVYERYMEELSSVRVVISYESAFGEKYEISDEVSVKLQNYNIEHWTQRDAPQVLNKVTTGYKGDFTLEWAMNNDLTEYEKEVWINAKGYASDSDYLIWISIAYQRVNIFEGSEKNWELIRSFIVGTGAPGSGTATGVCKTTYKQKDGWTTSKYTVRPVVRFRQGTGYAFHSRLYYPKDTGRLIDSRIGFPISHGCVRMYDEDIWYIYDNIPDGTTVVIF